jgi:hypothetical protein
MNELQTLGQKINLSVFNKQETISEEDKAKVREYAKLVKVQEDLHKEIQKVSRLMSFLNARWCREHLWINQKNEVIPIFDIDDDYLKNIYNWSLRNKSKLKKPIISEYIRRFGMPETLPDEDSKFKEKAHSSAAQEWYDEDDFF